jgi:hypothetical protein
VTYKIAVLWDWSPVIFGCEGEDIYKVRGGLKRGYHIHKVGAVASLITKHSGPDGRSDFVRTEHLSFVAHNNTHAQISDSLDRLSRQILR